MQITRRHMLGAAAAAAAALPVASRAQAAARPMKIGVLNDLSGPYKDTGGPTSIACTRQAVADFGRNGFDVQIVYADHQNKPDVGAGIARQWFDRDGVDMIVDVPTSSVALAVNTVVRDKNKVYINSGAGTPDLTGKQCSPNTVHWTYDTYMLAKSTGGALVKAGGDTWYFVTADYVFGHELQDDTAMFVKQAGGKVLGASRYPFPGTTDFSSFLLQAQSSGAKVLGFANAGADTVNCIKQAHEFGLTPKTKLAALLMFITDVHGLGLQTAQGLVLTESFYWNMNDRTRAFTKRLLAAQKPPQYPDMDSAGCYAGTMQYLKAVAKVGAAKAQSDGAAVVAAMKAMPCDDDAYGHSTIRADGRQVSPAYLFQVKTPAESKMPWDYYNLLGTTPADQAYAPMSAGGCSLVKS